MTVTDLTVKKLPPGFDMAPAVMSGVACYERAALFTNLFHWNQLQTVQSGIIFKTFR